MAKLGSAAIRGGLAAALDMYLVLLLGALGFHLDQWHSNSH